MRGYDAWKLRDPYADYDAAALCQCCEAEVSVIDDGDEDGRYRHVPDLCDACDEAGCLTMHNACRCACGADEAHRGVCGECDDFRRMAHAWLRPVAPARDEQLRGLLRRQPPGRDLGAALCERLEGVA